MGASCKKTIDFHALWCYDDTIQTAEMHERKESLKMTAPFQKMSDVLTSEQSMSCMDKTPCAFSQAAMSAFCARFTSKVVGVAVATSILFSVGFRVLTPLAGVLLAVLEKGNRRKRTATVCAVL